MILQRYESVEIAVPTGSTGTRFYFPDLPNLRNANIIALQLYTPATLSVTPNTGSTMVTLADLKKSSINLFSGDAQLVYNAPLLTFNPISNGTDPFIYELPIIQGNTIGSGMVISWVKSYVNLPTALSTTNVAYAFGVYYYLPA